MYKILCLTTGSEIKWPSRGYCRVPIKLVPEEVQEQIQHFYDTSYNGGIIYFGTFEAADWFVRRRLSYNPKRTDYSKLNFMNAVFEASDMSDVHFTKKHCFDIVEC